MKNAIIIGHTGQDGTYLGAYLESKGYDITGISSKTTTHSDKKNKELVDVNNYSSVAGIVKKNKPAEIYYLAATHQSSTEKTINHIELINKSFKVNVEGAANFLEAIKTESPATKFFYAASSHVFGNPFDSVQDENTPLNPICIYGTTKVAGIHLCNYYKNNHDVYAAIGIFYNHESPLRASHFVSKKIVEGAVAIKAGKSNKLILGNLESRVDWGFAGDYVKAAYQILQLNTPDTFVIGSGKTHSIKDFVEKTFHYLQLNWQNYVQIDPGLIAKAKRNQLCSNIDKIQNKTGWKPETGFETMIEQMVNEELKKQNG